MGRIVFLLATMTLSGCVAMTTVAAIPGALIGGAVGYFQAQEESLPVSMQISLASVQQGLHRMDLAVDVLEPVKEGYAIEFGNEKLDGIIELKRQTPKLTTVSFIVHHGVSRQKSVEQAIMKAVRKESERRSVQNFNFRGYHYIRIKPSIKTERIGWYRPGAILEASKSRKEGWLRIKMPSKKWGYLKGSLPKEHG
ncbi:MAG: SH3 domain-containing protein [Mariprofundaceae bacterium]|nr:SH3 domain-containing protein [Mariprofundaceae bacterium]